jgi:hypothetical protein
MLNITKIMQFFQGVVKIFVVVFIINSMAINSLHIFVKNISTFRVKLPVILLQKHIKSNLRT